MPAKRNIPNSRHFVSSALVLLALFLPASHPVGDSGQPPVWSAKIPASLDPLVPSYPEPVAAALEALERGAEDFSRARYDKSLEALTAIEAVNGFLVADYAVDLRARVWLKLGQPDEAARCFRTVRERWPHSRLRREALLGECTALVEAGQPKEALTLLEGSGLGVDSGTLYHRALIEEALGNRKAALALYLRVYTDYVNASEATQAEERLSALAPAYMSMPEHFASLLQRGDNLLRAGRSADARSILLRLAAVKTAGVAARQRRNVLLADAERRRGRHLTALGLLRGVTAVDAETHARALYLQVACNRALKREGEFTKARNLAVRLYPKSDWTERALYSVATFYDVENRVESIEEAYQALLTSFPQGAHARRASWEVAICAYLDGRYGEALLRFSRHLESFSAPATAAGAGYWMGRCYEKLGDSRSALAMYRCVATLANQSYYGQRAQQAAARLNLEGREVGMVSPGPKLLQALRTLESLWVRPVVIEEPAGPAELAIERARQLVSAGLTEDSLEELRAAAERYPAETAIPYVAARVHERRGDLLSAMRVLYRATPNYALLPVTSLPHEIRNMLFPVRHLDLVQAHSAANSLEPSLVLAIIRQESAFKEDARSSAGARGLMQVLPSTGRRLARQAGLRGYSVGKLYQAATNIQIGTRHFSVLLRMFGGNVELALASYNAGETRVQRWKKQFGDDDIALFVEQVPFTETREYLKQVLTSHAYYRAILEPNSYAGR